MNREQLREYLSRAKPSASEASWATPQRAPESTREHRKAPKSPGIKIIVRNRYEIAKLQLHAELAATDKPQLVERQTELFLMIEYGRGKTVENRTETDQNGPKSVRF